MNDIDRALGELTTELQAAEASGKVVLVTLSPVAALTIAGVLQLALRHPALTTHSRHNAVVARQLLEQIRGYFADSPVALELLRRGDDPSHDIVFDTPDPRRI